MKFLTPHFWYPDSGKNTGWESLLLSPLACLYGMGQRLNFKSKAPYKAEIPVLCVGNVVAGGAGKTPTALALMKIIQENSIATTPYFLTRGHGGSLKNSVLVDPDCHDALMVGDETLLLARQAPVIRAANRPLGAVMAWQDGADFIVMDDGFQNPSLHKDIGILVIEGAIGFGNGKLLPAGPLREDVAAALSRAQGVVIIGKDLHNVRAVIPDTLPVFEAVVEAVVEAVSAPKAQNYVAFCGLGRPEKFFHTLHELGVPVMEEHHFPDHYFYTQKDLDYLIGRAKDSNATLITTEKDRVKLLGLNGADEVETLPIHLVWKEDAAVLSFLKGAL